MQNELRGRIALVTGGAHRVGKAIALELARSGVHVVVNYNRTADDVVAETVSEIMSCGVEAVALQGDVSRPADVTAMFERIKDSVGTLDIVVNSASVFPSGTLAETSFETWQQALDVNVTGPFLVTQAAAQLMQRTTRKAA
ncbi:MAG: SDR family NAD(P)-dependent oxidoreductase [Chloroflexi bacterium]|nr:SDR family NAD(P)-dependent oxidoreductase [Chloroflexota bacterium]